MVPHESARALQVSQPVWGFIRSMNEIKQALIKRERVRLALGIPYPSPKKRDVFRCRSHFRYLLHWTNVIPLMLARNRVDSIDGINPSNG